MSLFAIWAMLVAVSVPAVDAIQAEDTVQGEVLHRSDQQPQETQLYAIVEDPVVRVKRAACAGK